MAKLSLSVLYPFKFGFWMYTADKDYHDSDAGWAAAEQ